MKEKGVRGSPYKTRNQSVIEDRESGMSWRRIAQKYKISDTRAQEIYKLYR